MSDIEKYREAKDRLDSCMPGGHERESAKPSTYEPLDDVARRWMVAHPYEPLIIKGQNVLIRWNTTMCLFQRDVNYTGWKSWSADPEEPMMVRPLRGYWETPGEDE